MTNYTIEQAEQLKGKELLDAEKKIVELFGNDSNYEIYLDLNGHIAARSLKGANLSR
ncbi:hypothetical protein [Mucilaginibacter terrenus]|uniref:hypothetical protein n=1 Tax=Mucilaginibacter terrenus TaxID=2482727 RepID=UPI001401E6C4|nr:hypothetical protein [Mucilaginibacter terrenus]